MSSKATFYWHDYETFGINPARDRPAQFAGIRTDEALNIIGDPLVVYCRPAPDRLPSPDACLITGITPQHARENGLIEAEFIRLILRELATPGTCGAGYNSLRFDDEFTRYTLFRNFHDPYAREWQNDCSRWDLIDLTRMTAALRPDGIEWPHNDQGNPSFRLEHLTAANGIEHSDAHDALADVHATIAMARLVRDRQPKLYQWLFDLRSKHKVAELIDLQQGKPLVHTTRMYPSSRWCTSLVLPLVFEQRNRNSVLVYDLRVDPEAFLDLPESELNRRLFTAAEELSETAPRLPVKSVKINRSPALAPLTTLDAAAQQRIDIDLDNCARHRELLRRHPDFSQRVAAAFSLQAFEPREDVDGSLYDGFLNEQDRRLVQRVNGSTPSELADQHFDFQDGRLPELLFRYRARNWPETLDDTERETWRAHCQDQYQDDADGLESYFERIAELRGAESEGSDQTQVLDALESWGDELVSGEYDG